ncbi:MAG: asparagine synthase (glutamine-hydrolyzing) [Nanoarchaeota archaeon]
MCGIAGWYGPSNRKLLEKMTSFLDHRGPDGEGFFVDKKVSLGHKRLSIIDLKTGQQPIYNDDKSAVIVFNGEIYNYKEIRKDLEKKYTFKTKSDTEVILRAYEEYGPECVQTFNGMFAFAIWDAKKDLLFLARDRLGVKPLYYYQNATKLMFASEIKAFLADPTFPRQLHHQAVAEYLTFQNIMDDKTFFAGVKMLLPGHYLVVQEGKDVIKQYWDASYVKSNKQKVEEYYADFRSILSRSVARHMVSDVPVGSYLSGGFDSGSIATFAAGKSQKRIEAFTGTFKEGGIYDETKGSRLVAQKINAVVHEAVVSSQDFVSSIEKILYHLDEPKTGIPVISQYVVSKLVSEQVKVVLTGHAGDELFAGYPIYKVAYFKDLVRKNPFTALRFFSFFTWSEMPRSLYFLFFPLFDKEVKHGLFIMFNKRQRKKLLSKQFYQGLPDKNTVSVLEKFCRPDLKSQTDKIQYLYLKTYLPSLLVCEDKMGMAHAIEARVPFCDNEMVDFANSIPLKFKLYGHELKHIIKQSMKKDLPSIHYHQQKKGYPTPFSLWLRKDLKEYVYSVLLSERTKQRGIFNQKYVKKLLDAHCGRSKDGLMDLVNAARIWSLLNVELWCRIFIDGEYEKFATDKLKKPERAVKA